MNVESHGLFVMLLLPKQKRYCNEHAENMLRGEHIEVVLPGMSARYTGQDTDKRKRTANFMVWSSWSGGALLQPSVTIGCSAGEDYSTHSEMAPRFPSVVVLITVRQTSPLLRAHEEQGPGVRTRVAVSVYCDSGGGVTRSCGQRSSSQEEDEGGGRDARVGLRRGV